MLFVLELQSRRTVASRAHSGESSAGRADGAAECARLCGAELADGKRTQTALDGLCTPPCNIPTPPTFSLSRARFSVLTPATHLPGSSPACHRRLAEAAQPSARAYAAGERDSGPHGLRAGGSVRLAMRAPRSHARSRRWAFLGLWCTAQAAEGVLYTLSAPCWSSPLIYEWVGLFGG